MIYKSNKLLYVLILIYTHILKVSESTISFYRHKDDAYEDFDITTIYRVTNMSSFDGTFNGMNSVIEIHSRTNAIGMPIQDNDDDIHIISMNIKEIINIGSFQNNSQMSTSYNSDEWNQRTRDLNGHGCEKNDSKNYRSIGTGNQLNKCNNVFEYNNHNVMIQCFVHGHRHGHGHGYDDDDDDNSPVDNNVFTFYWTPDKDDQTCLTMTYYVSYYDKNNIPFVIKMEVNDENNNMLISSTVLDQNHDTITLKISNIDFKKNQQYKLSLKIIQASRHCDSFIQFWLIRISQCSNYDEDDVRIISVDHVPGKKPKPFNILGNLIVEPSNDHGACLNGGYIIKESSKCVCPPGFKGQFCETGCGVNSYGSDCKGVCSIQADKMCRGMLMCTSYGCTCPAGLTGPSCNEDCTMGTYGADCRQTCSENCLNNMCDQYTGVCLYGCSVGYILPYCSEKYPYLFNPPTLRRFSNYDAIEIELDFQEHNIKGGDYKIQPKYYQLFYKSLVENTFRRSVIKLISNTNNVTSEVIRDLEPNTKYTVGVLLIADDGDFNEQNIVYGHYRTPCMQNDVQIKNISSKNENGKITVNWIFVNSHHLYTTVDEPVTSIIKYKVKRILSCSIRELEENWTSITIFNRTNYEIIDTVPNSQYSIQVWVNGTDKITTQQENMINVLTPASKPKTEPILDPDHPMYITNNSIFVQWKFDPENCSKLNGFLSQFYIELKDKGDDILQIRETKNNYISFSDLRPNTAYELKVFIKTHFGYNPEHFLLTNFMTKYKYLKPVEDLMVYKKSVQNHMVGFRWTYSQHKNIDGFIVSLNDNTLINTKNVSIIPPQKCSAWPEYYCHIFYNLSPSKNYTFEIKPKSIDYPEDGDVSSISFNIIDGLPDSPMNLKTTEIGSTTIALQWDTPWIFNSVLNMFIINVEEISSNDMGTCCVSITPTEISVNEELPTYNYTVTGLQPGSTYLIGVSTVSKSLWYSSPSKLSATLPTI